MIANGYSTAELHSLTTADGETIVLGRNNNIRFRLFGNYGSPPLDFITRRGYRQHGVTEVDIFAQSRIISTELYREPACTRQDYWDMRSELIDFFRWNRGGPLLFTVTLPDGTNRSLYVRADPGLQFPPEQNVDWNIIERMDFVAFDPFWFGDAITIEATSNAVTTEELVFPITFPIFFGGMSDQWRGTGTIAYEGTWIAYPTIVLTGPYDSVLIDNYMTGAQIGLNVPIGSGESRTIDLTPGEQSITSGVLGFFNELSVGSDLVNFYIQPAPLAALATEEIVAFFSNATSETSITITYRPRYIGI